MNCDQEALLSQEQTNAVARSQKKVRTGEGGDTVGRPVVLRMEEWMLEVPLEGDGHSDCVHSIDLSDSDSDSISDSLVSTNSDIMAGEQANHHTLKELGAPDVNYQPLCIQYPDLAANFELKSGLIHLLPKFHGLADKGLVDASSGGAMSNKTLKKLEN
ncbi:hypothetical protein K1719_006306 [Acacia pycnantha]|nr:hypothetical protein K1719_006306 [Acacia pycnantha]